MMRPAQKLGVVGAISLAFVNRMTRALVTLEEFLIVRGCLECSLLKFFPQILKDVETNILSELWT